MSVLQYRRESTGSVKGEHADGGRYIIINDVGTKCGYWPDRGGHSSEAVSDLLRYSLTLIVA